VSQIALAVSVAPVHPVVGAFSAARAAEGIHLSLRQLVDDPLEHGAQHVKLSLLDDVADEVQAGHAGRGDRRSSKKSST